MDCRRILISIMPVFFVAAAPAGALLTVSSGDSGLAGRTLTLDGKFVGVVGDTIVVEKATSQLAVQLPGGPAAFMTLQLSSSTLAATAPVGGDCLNNVAVSIRGATVPLISGSGTQFTLALPKVPLVQGGGCSSNPSSLNCVQTAAQIDVKSVPEVHAAIWAGGKDTHSSTPATNSYPFCVGMTPRMDFVLRKDGFANCAADIRADGRTTPYSIECSLPAAAPRH
jgi:hypothetical protein